MVAIKVECPCGQHYAFDVEPVNGRMPSSVACPTCGADGTLAANQIISSAMAVAPVATAVSSYHLRPMEAVAPPPPPPIPPPVPMTSKARGPAKKSLMGNDGWATEETGFNKLGTYIVIIASGGAALISWGMFGLAVPVTTLCVIVAICGVIGGIINIYGRGPIFAGAIVGVVMALGGYGTVYWWIQGRENVRTFEITIAFVVGALPGMLLQYGLQKFLHRK